MAIIRYINPASTPGGNGTTPGTVGADRAYAGMVEWDAQEGGNLSDVHIVRCVAGTNTEDVDIDGWSSGVDEPDIVIESNDDGHKTVVGNGYILQSGSGTTLDIREFNVKVRDITLRHGGSFHCLVVRDGRRYSEISRVIFQGYNSTGNGFITIGTVDGGNDTVFDSCLFLDCNGSSGAININDSGGVRNVFNNCTIADSQNGITVNSNDDWEFNNCVVYNSANVDWQDTGGSGNIIGSHNASSDGTAFGTNVVSDSIASGDFEDAANDNFRPVGTSLLATGANAANLPNFDLGGGAWFNPSTGCLAYIGTQSETPVAGGRFFSGFGITAEAATTNGVFYSGFGINYQENLTDTNVIVNLDNAVDHEITVGVPTVQAVEDFASTLANAVDHEITIGVIDGDVPDQDRIVNLINAILVATNPTAPTVDVPTSDDVLLPNALDHQINVGVPTTDARVDFQSDLGNAVDHEITVGIPPVVAGGEQIVNLVEAVVLAFDPPDNIPITAPLLFESNLGNAADLSIDIGVPTSEGENTLPPVITTPTSDQIYTFNAIGVLAAPPHSVGTGSNPTWTMPVDEMTGKAGVLVWSINATTGDITYQLAQVSNDSDVQALNTKGPYNITRRLTTTVSFVDESFQVAVNVGNRTLKMTPGGKPCLTWDTKTAAARGLEPTKDPSARVTQTYTVT